mmetsp:Transcript_10471/g.17053  ORF Transcript_10471/g.17053 Transcript_10471/m.17053 type:complete len:83 (+) Transcript_10471:47-295(+)|eukprot:CAMPEP_0203766070 /NCGR_PEP_ID=MMETSP0099_2-20121227/209_1 /ASSEMBLY_ACC=CAM_ASM_000209 /TAXON_ID=96639 /ORGANISM=" , Strain NY0313808BC1" /LENGTH=82 /DNA_ID=CAMNT_0050662371 /DNA_START=49 /DNA_END=297 /DNA_ORIENTATION=+
MNALQTIARRSALGLRYQPVLARSMCSHASPDAPLEKTEQGAYIVDNVAFTLEWVLSSPPPLHCFEEPPIMVEWPEGEEGHH